ncbi:DNA cytosine methyltransferase [Methylobacterium sp. J-030]|uniref:DNA cytosine methyltransferase n=1 Tax=Methylobacterium sp. J-030 TaxID=2836627 RepID=UPI001FB9E23F|nr:DNA cytosine methyltransferase [Methylobacterium sp. J-030]MCJ2069324.1 DNA cytosine methyltransferase [Methylobacterium sp. J-030]
MVDVFCGAGGLSLGLRDAGLTIAAGIDLDPACRYPFEHNIGASFHGRDIMEVSATEVSAMFGEAPIRVLAGCAPCQPFSGYTTKRRESDGRWRLLLEFLRFVELVRPEIITLENVPRLTLLPLWGEFVRALEALGYHVVWKVVDAADFGVPQNRRRVVLLASRLGTIEMPKGTEQQHRTVRDEVFDRPPVEAGECDRQDRLHRARGLTAINLERIRIAEPHGTWRCWPEHMRVKCHTELTGRTYPSVYGRMAWDKPSPTITTQFYGFGNGRFGHPEQDRALTLREGAMLQSFPANFQFVPPGKPIVARTVGRLIGNAVPPALGRAVGKAIIDHIRSQEN